MNQKIYAGQYFDLLAYQRGKAPVLHAYIEGDGKAWRNRRQPSNNPTPSVPVGLLLASKDTHDAVLYLSRPCQYVEGDSLRNCNIPFWTSARFAEPVIADINAILDQAKKQAGASKVQLIGYSGGGAVALLLAARRSDVDLVVTVAGNVDHEAWTKLHGVSPLRDSLNPTDQVDTLKLIPQLHIVSNDDDVVPPSVLESYLAKMGDSSMVRIVRIDGIDHTGDWQEIVPGILTRSGVW